jgi:hypothetical protein
MAKKRVITKEKKVPLLIIDHLKKPIDALYKQEKKLQNEYDVVNPNTSAEWSEAVNVEIEWMKGKLIEAGVL